MNNIRFFYFIYGLFAVVSFLGVLISTKNKIVSGLISFWILSFPLLNRIEFMIQTPWGFDLQPTRIFLILSSSYLFISTLNKIIKNGIGNINLFFYEFSLIGYVMISSGVILFKSSRIALGLPHIFDYVVFLMMYFISRDYIGKHDRIKLEKLLIIFGCLSVIVSIIQFFWHPSFFRLSSERIAYGNFIRANGFLFNEYENSYFLTIVSGLLLFSKRSGWKKFLLVLFFGLGVFFSMHRVSWIIFSCAILIYTIIQLKKTPKKMITLMLFILVIILLTGALAYISIINISFSKVVFRDFVKNRLLENTLIIRNQLLEFGLQVVGKHPLGIGDFSYSIYEQMYLDYGLRLHYGRPLVVHNGYLAAFIKSGILGGLLFAIYIISVFISSLKKSHVESSIKYLIFTIFTGLLVINLTQNFSALGTFPQLIIAFFLGEFGKRINEVSNC